MGSLTENKTLVNGFHECETLVNGFHKSETLVNGFHESAKTNWMMSNDIETEDKEMYDLIKSEKKRQVYGLELIASENFTSKACIQALGSCLTNKYSEGEIGKRYYGGNEIIDKVEGLVKERALQCFKLNPEEWGVNVQVLSGSPANFAVYTAIVEPHGRIMGLDLPDGGHLSHGFFTPTKKISATSIYFESMPYKVNPETGLIDYDELQKNAKLFRPKVIVAGTSCYSRVLDYKRFREICDENDSYLMSDMAHVSGLVAAGVIPSPFDYSDIVTTTTHKSLRGPRAAMVFFRKGVRKTKPNGEKIMYDFEKKINEAVFPGLNGGPHNHAIASVGVALKQAMTPEFREYQEDVIKNAKLLSKNFQKLGYKVVSGDTETHLVLIDLRPKQTNGARAEKVLEEMCIALNKNTCPGDKSALKPSGLRIGTPALTSRGFKEADFEKVVEYIHKGIELTLEIQTNCGPTLKEFTEKLFSEPYHSKVNALKSEVNNFSAQYPMPGYDCW